MDRERAVAISHLSFLRAREKQVLYTATPSLAALLRLSRDDIGDIVGRRLYTRAWAPGRLGLKVRETGAFLHARGVALLCLGERGYPSWLAQIYDPPFLLFVIGAGLRGPAQAPSPHTEEAPMLAIVGTRSPSHDGRAAARSLAREAARARVPVVSGLARGIDTEAHRGALEGGGTTIAVLGSGIDTIYPAQNRLLAARIADSGGAIVSEYPPGVPPRQFNFPERNRIISGLARATVVVEAPERSGALITADYALDQGRDLFVHEVAQTSGRAAGARALVSDGAIVVGGMADVAAAWGTEAGRVVGAGDVASGAGSAGSGSAGSGVSDRTTAGAGRQLALELEAELSGGNNG